MIRSLIAVGIGAAIGAWGRWGLSLWLNSSHTLFPFGTLAANLVGGYLIGLALAWFAHCPGVPAEWRLFIVTGLLGGLTTFSTFSAEVVQLLNRQDYWWAMAVMFAHLLGSFALTALGLVTFRLFRSI
ncbi:MAG: fluoride efflux transporter CrcB [Xanthomonadaceae bacterium]|jgi:CrcB protein|nr:fluoride efflux transporter CrcB [Xanthomonadaceae bacterium]